MGHILTEYVDGIVTVTIENEKKLNAWDDAMRRRFIAVFDELARDPECRAVVLTGAGERAFCAGGDIAEVSAFDPNQVEGAMGGYEQAFDALWRFQKPVVAAVRGVAAGSGFQLSMLCDLIVAHPEARFGQPELRSGLASITGSWIIAQAVGFMRMKDLVSTGRLISGATAADWGIVSRLVESDLVLETALEAALDLATVAPGPFSASKRALFEMYEDGYRRAFEIAKEVHPTIDVSAASIGGKSISS